MCPKAQAGPSEKEGFRIFLYSEAFLAGEGLGVFADRIFDSCFAPSS